MKKFVVEFTYNIRVNAEDKDDALEEALDVWQEENHTADEMNIRITEVK